MIQFKFELNSQTDRYNAVKDKIKNKDFYQKLNFYVLPFMPEKFRDRVIYLPKECNYKKDYDKHLKKIQLLKKKWLLAEDKFINDLKKYFPKIRLLKIYIEPSIYGTIGSYNIKSKSSIYIYPRYDRKIIDIQKLLINALTHYFMFDPKDEMDELNEKWIEKQRIAKKIQEDVFPNQKFKSMTEILDRRFAGKLAEKSTVYLQELGLQKSIKIKRPLNLTKSESLVFTLLTENKNKLVTFDQIADCIWRDMSDVKYSEYAMTKLIERLKKKVPKNIIHTQRGIGYILISS